MSRKYFGTDGVRGRVGQTPITPEFAMLLAQAAGRILKQQTTDGEVGVFIGKDTRVSGYMLEAALQAGFLSAGVDVMLGGPLPTPAVAYLTRAQRLSAGVVISASHNPFYDNGIKFFSDKGTKLPDEMELQIEKEMDRGFSCVDSARLGKARRLDDAAGRYVEFCKSTFPSDLDLKGFKIYVDCANGASYTTAARLFDRFPKLRTDVINADPDGVNINDKCGSTHIDSLAAMVKAGGYDIGIAFDGDADRCLAVDEQGNLIDGDQIMAACGLDRKEKGQLPGDTVVATVMSNLGLHVFAGEHGLKLECTSVGDRNVLERMQEKGYVLGGEQSGHMIFLDYATTGDGQLTALQVLALLKESGKKASEVFSSCARYPQVLINVPVASNDVKKAVMASDALWAAVRGEEEQLAGSGRVLVRPSGTEALMRVMVEAKTEETAQAAADRLAALIPGLVEC